MLGNNCFEHTAMTLFRKKRHHEQRFGTTIVETALVLPIYLMFIFALIELGHAVMVNNLIRSACRTAARMGSTEGRTTADVEALVSQILARAIDPNVVDIMVKNADVYDSGGTPPTTSEGIEELPGLELSDAETRQMFLVRASVPYLSVAILPINVPYVGAFLKEIELSGQAFMRHE